MLILLLFNAVVSVTCRIVHWFRHHAKIRRVAGSIPSEVTEFFN
jgi:hypothetical protein